MYHRPVGGSVASIDADVHKAASVHSVGDYSSGSRSETAGQQGVRNANVSPRNCLLRNVGRKKTSAGRDIETRHAPQPTLRPTFALAIGVANRDGSCHRLSQPPPRVVPLPPILLNSSSSFFFFLHFEDKSLRRIR